MSGAFSDSNRRLWQPAATPRVPGRETARFSSLVWSSSFSYLEIYDRITSSQRTWRAKPSDNHGPEVSFAPSSALVAITVTDGPSLVRNPTRRGETLRHFDRAASQRLRRVRGNLKEAHPRRYGSKRNPAAVRDAPLWLCTCICSGRFGSDVLFAERCFYRWISVFLHRRGGQRLVRWKMARRNRRHPERPLR